MYWANVKEFLKGILNLIINEKHTFTAWRYKILETWWLRGIPERWNKYKLLNTSGGFFSASVGSDTLFTWAVGILEACEGLTSPPSIASGFFFFNFANMDDSRSGNGGISSSTVAYLNHSIINIYEYASSLLQDYN